jgi:two-component system CheB/CheR fusion protein
VNNHIYRNRKIANYRYQDTEELESECSNRRRFAELTQFQMQSRREELKSINEELQSTKKMQSTNEELTTSKKRCNEELQTVNIELHNKLE